MGGVDAVAEVMDQVEENVQDVEEIQNELARTVAVPGLEDEDDLLAELEGMVEGELANEMASMQLPDAGKGEVIEQDKYEQFPSAGTGKVMTDEERELAELEASMAM